jgi:hypothetical protein
MEGDAAGVHSVEEAPLGGRWSSIPTLASTCMLLAACSGGHARFIPHPGDGGVADADRGPPPDGVDILFLVDTSCEAGPMQEELGRSAEVLFRELLEPTPDPTTGRTAPPVRDLHVGVTTMSADMAGFVYYGCEEPEEGALVFQEWNECPSTMVPAADCDAPPCRWLQGAGDAPREPAIWEDTACLLRFGGCGCGWEQPLEAARLALTVQSEPGGPNHGFRREDSVLAIVFMGSEDDCSAADPRLFDPDLGHPTTVCHLYPDMLQPVASYAEELRAVRPGIEERVVVGVLTGLPPDFSWQPGDPVEDLRSMIRVDPENPQDLWPACTSPGGWAFPAPRLIELAYAFGDGAFVASICQEDWSESMMGLARTIQRRLQ